MAGTPIVPPSPSPIPSSTTGPADGDLANAASVNVAFLDLMDGVLGLRLASYGRRERVSVSSFNGTSLTIGALGAVLLTSGGTTWYSFLNSTAQTVVAATAFGGALGNSTRYYLYAYNNAGTLDFIVNTTLPNASRTYENGNTDRAFITTFITDSAGIIVPFTHIGHDYNYGPKTDFSVGGGSTILRVANVAATGTATVTLSTLVIPSWALAATMNYYAYDTVSGYVQDTGITATGYTTAGGLSNSFHINITGVLGQDGQFSIAFPQSVAMLYSFTIGGGSYIQIGVGGFTM